MSTKLKHPESRREYPDRPLIGVGVVLLRQDQVLLVCRGKPPANGAWSLPGGAQEIGETAEDGARRELLEETGIRAGPMTFVAHVDSIHRDMNGVVQYHYTILDFAAAWLDGDPIPGGDVVAAEFVSFSDLDSKHLSVDVLRVIALARMLLGFGGDATVKPSQD